MSDPRKDRISSSTDQSRRPAGIRLVPTLTSPPLRTFSGLVPVRIIVSKNSTCFATSRSKLVNYPVNNSRCCLQDHRLRCARLERKTPRIVFVALSNARQSLLQQAYDSVRRYYLGEGHMVSPQEISPSYPVSPHTLTAYHIMSSERNCWNNCGDNLLSVRKGERSDKAEHCEHTRLSTRIRGRPAGSRRCWRTKLRASNRERVQETSKSCFYCKQTRHGNRVERGVGLCVCNECEMMASADVSEPRIFDKDEADFESLTKENNRSSVDRSHTCSRN